jgi:hypothetical protein
MDGAKLEGEKLTVEPTSKSLYVLIKSFFRGQRPERAFPERQVLDLRQIRSLVRTKLKEALR